MKNNWKISSLNFMIIFAAGLLRLGLKDSQFQISILTVAFALFGAIVGVIIINMVGIFSKEKVVPQEVQKHMNKLIAIKTIQIGIFIFMLATIFSSKIILEAFGNSIGILIIFLPITILFGLPGYIGYKYEVLYSGILQFGGTYITSKDAKLKGKMLLIMSLIIAIAIIALAIASAKVPFN